MTAIETMGPTKDQTGEGGRRRFTVEIVQAGLAAADICLILLAAVVAGLLWQVSVGLDSIADLAGFGILTAALFTTFFGLRRGYSVASLSDVATQVRLVVQTWLLTYFLIGWVAFLTKSSADLSRGVVSIHFLLGLGGVALLHGAGARWLATHFSSNRISLRRVALILEASAVDVDDLRRHFESKGVEVVGHSVLDPGTITSRPFAGSCRIALRELRATMATTKIDAVYLFMPWSDGRRIAELRAIFGPLPVPILLFADRSTETLLARPPVRLGRLVGFELQRSALSRFDRAAKRLLDIAVAGIALLLLSPLLALTSVGILIETGRPILFRQKRKGFGARPFDILKFRSMTVQENGPDVLQATRNDARVTRLGRMLRRTSIDELPQIVNVLRGDMSIVGPRPHAMAHDDHYDRLIATYAFRQHVKPGITGWAQINGHRGETREVGQMSARVEHDLWYINNWSLWLDIKIIALTAIRVLMDDQAY